MLFSETGSSACNAKWAFDFTNNTLVPYSGAAGNRYQLPATQFSFNETKTFQFTFTIPNGFAANRYDVFFITGAENLNNAAAAGTFTNSSMCQVSTSGSATSNAYRISYKNSIDLTGKKKVIFNTAWVGDKSSTARLIVSSTNKLRVEATPPGNFGGEHTFYTSQLNVELKAISGGIETDDAIIQYTLDGSDPRTSSTRVPYNTAQKLLLNKELFSNTDRITVKTFALSHSGDDGDSDIGEWTFIRELQKLNISAFLPDSSNKKLDESQEFILREKEIKINLIAEDINANVARDIEIIWTINGENPKNGNLPYLLDKDYFKTGVVEIKAKAVDNLGNHIDSETKTWIIKRDLPEVYISVSNYDVDTLKDENGVILFDTKIFGSNTPIPSEIGIAPDGNIKLVVRRKDNDALVDNIVIYYSELGALDWCNNNTRTPQGSNGIEISKTITITAGICSDDYVFKNFVLSFNQQLPSPFVDVWLVPQDKSAKHPVQEFGAEQEIQIKYDSDGSRTLYYKWGNTQTDSAALYSETAHTNQPAFVISGNNEIYVSVLVVEKDDVATYRVWKFVQKNLSPVKLYEGTTEIPGGLKKFTNSLTITARVDNLPADTANMGFGIYYTTDGSKPSQEKGYKIANGSTITLQKDGDNGDIRLFDGSGNEIKIHGSFVNLQFEAWIYNRLPSDTKSQDFRLTADGSGYYFDTNGDGFIDSVVIITTIPVNEAPNEIILTSPWNNSNTVTFSKSKNEIKRINSTTLVIYKPDGIFKWANVEEIRTGFNAENLGKISGGIEYSDTGRVKIEDRVAPVPVKAIYTPGSINENAYRNTGIIEKGRDTLVVYFSEPTSIISGANTETMFEFQSGGEWYQLKVKPVSSGSSGDVIVFEVIGKDGNGIPSNGDSLCVKENIIRESKSGGVIQENKTRLAEMQVNPTGYLPIIDAISPIVPGKPTPIAVINLLTTTISPEEAAKLDIAGQIIDATGNLVASIDKGNWRITNIRCKVMEDDVAVDANAIGIIVEWNGKNRTGRDVGNGAYLAIIQLVGPDGSTHNLNITVGVSKSVK
jgi:hypothetical protein